MHVNVFAPAAQALLENDAATARVLPMVRCGIPPRLPMAITLPIVLSVWTNAGEDFDPHFYIRAYDPDGNRQPGIEHLWHWPDTPGKPFKFQVFADYLQLTVPMEGFYRIGLYDDPDQTETDIWFPLEVYIDPAAPLPPNPSSN